MSDEKPQDPPEKEQGSNTVKAKAAAAKAAVEAIEAKAAAAKAAVEAIEAKAAAAKAAADAATKEYEAAVEVAAKAAVEAEKEYEVAAKAAMARSVAAKASGESYTNKRNQERIFRREMDEPEFFHTKKDLVPPRPILTEEEQEEISKSVENPSDQTPAYNPKFILSPEFGGTSNYESGITEMVIESRQRLDRLKNDPFANADDIIRAEQDLEYLDSLYQNFYFGMNVFRTAKGGRDKLRE
jgi:colicin import membrane protein